MLCLKSKYLVLYLPPGDTDEISFTEGEIITSVVAVDDGWAKGTCHGRTGLFPISYAEEQPDSPPPVVKPARSNSVKASTVDSDEGVMWRSNL